MVWRRPFCFAGLSFRSTSPPIGKPSVFAWRLRRLKTASDKTVAPDTASDQSAVIGNQLTADGGRQDRRSLRRSWSYAGQAATCALRRGSLRLRSGSTTGQAKRQELAALQITSTVNPWPFTHPCYPFDFAQDKPCHPWLKMS